MADYSPEIIVGAGDLGLLAATLTYAPPPIIAGGLVLRHITSPSQYLPAPIIAAGIATPAPTDPATFGRGDRRDYYVQSREGMLYASDGWGRVRRWDGLTDTWELAGVPAPSKPPLFRVVSNKPGFLAGSWTAYYRYLDRFFNPGNPSPPSATLTVADISGDIQSVEGESVLTITSPGHGLESGGRRDLSTKLGDKIAIRWPSGEEEVVSYSVVDEDSFAIAVSSAAFREPGGQWAHNIQGFQYGFIDPSEIEILSGFTTGAPAGNVITVEGHGLEAFGVDGESDGTITLYEREWSGNLGGVATPPFQDTNHLLYTLRPVTYQFKVWTESKLGLYYMPSDGSYSESGLAYAGRELGAPADVVGSKTWSPLIKGSDGNIIQGETYKSYPNGTPWSATPWPSVSPVPEEVELVQILRTRDGSGAAAYVDVEVEPRTAGAVSYKPDGELGEEVVLIDPFTGDASYSQRFGLPPNDKPYMAAVGGRMVAAGDPTWSEGAVRTTNGSKRVYGIATAWSGDFTDRLLTVDGADKGYEIATREGQVIVLREAYGGESREYASYAVGPSYRYRRLLWWSEAGYPEAWYALSTVFLPADAEGGRVTGLASFDNAAICFTESRSFRFSFTNDPAMDGSAIPAFDRGATNQLCWTRSDGHLYAMDERGAYRTTGLRVDDISAAIGNIFSGFDDEFSVNWRWKRYFHVILDPRNDSVLFVVSLTGGEPRHILAFRTLTNAWDILEYPVPLNASSVARVSGRLRVVMGTDNSTVLATDEGEYDGSVSGTLSGSATSTGYDWIADSTAAFSGLANRSVHLTSGAGKGQWRKIVSTDGQTLHLDTPWKIKPAAGDGYVVAGVDWVWRTGWYPWVRSDREQPRNINLIYQPVDDTSTVDMRLYRDQLAAPKQMGVNRSADGFRSTRGSEDIELDVDKANGYAQFQCDDGKESRADGERRVSVELTGVTGGSPYSLYELEIEGASQ